MLIAIETIWDLKTRSTHREVVSFAARREVITHVMINAAIVAWQLICWFPLRSDPLGLRYYLPALMLSLLDRYDPSSMRTIGTLHGSLPSAGYPSDVATHRFSLLSPIHKRAVARFLFLLADLVKLDCEDEKTVSRALERYWAVFLDQNS
ncbi:DUF6714 family protein [Devosia sp. UYZn731]|uniref:DUF6714 family protein n=1 Tax=Devosia sp. UYZn731 TaxID=3156345 RepID=UPI0033994DA4